MNAAARINHAGPFTQSQIRWNTPPHPNMQERLLAIAICRACTGGSQDADSVAVRIADTLGSMRTKGIVAMAARYTRAFNAGIAPRERDVLRFVLRDSTWLSRIRARTPKAKPRRVHAWPVEAPRMHPAKSATDWPLPRLETSGALAEWLRISVEELEWFADMKGLLRGVRQSPMHHYHYRIMRKPSGGFRLIEAPQTRLKTIQRTILAELLNKIPPYYAAAHGFVKGRSVRTFAQPHVGKQAVVRIDLKDFFPTIGHSRVQALFRTMGYPDAVATSLAGLCTNATPRAVFVGEASNPADLEQVIKARELYSRPHLPQGAPTSPLIANLCAYRLDCRLTGLADWAGAVYTRYADDIALSGDESFARNAARYAAQASAIAMDEGWRVQHHKTRVMRAGVQQHLAGLVVNEHLNVSRGSFDQLKAILNNCVRLGFAGQNRDGHADFRAHLRGRVAWVTSVSPHRGKRLHDIFQRIRWD